MNHDRDILGPTGDPTPSGSVSPCDGYEGDEDFAEDTPPETWEDVGPDLIKAAKQVDLEYEADNMSLQTILALGRAVARAEAVEEQ